MPAIASRDVDLVPAQSQHRGDALRLIVGEVQRNGRRHRLGLSGRLQVQLDHEVGAWLESPSHALRQQWCDLSGRPPEEMAVRILRGVGHQPVVTGSGVGGVELARSARVVDPDIGVMHDPGVSRTELEPPDEARGLQRDRQHEDAKHVRPVRRENVGLAKRDHVIGRAKLPPGAPLGGGGTIGRRPFWRAILHPTLDALNLGFRQRMLVSERPAMSGLGLPRGHHAAAGELRDQAGAPLRGGIREQLEGRRSARPVARGAAREQDRGDVGVERHRRWRLGRGHGRPPTAQRDREDGDPPARSSAGPHPGC